MKSVITKLEARTEDATWGKIPYDVEIKGQRVGGLVVRKVPKMVSGALDMIEIVAPMAGDKLAVALPTLDGIARAVSPTARILSRSTSGPARLMRYAV